MKKTILLPLLFAIFTMSSIAQLNEMPNLVTTDVNDNPVNIYEDYLNQGKPVLIHFMAAWNPWDEFVFEAGALQEFYQLYGPNGFDLAGIVSYEIDSVTTDEDLMGNTNQFDYNYVANADWPIVNEENPLWGLDTFGIFAMPSFALVCPNGTVWVSETLNPMFPAIVLENWVYSEILELNGLIDFFEIGCEFDLPDDNIQGFTTFDSDNCAFIPENGMVGTKVIFNDGTGSEFITYSLLGGMYEYALPDGTYDLTYEPIFPLYEVCEQEDQITISGDTLTNINAIFNPLIDCPSLQVEIAPWITRPCEVPSYMAAAVCNAGPIPYNGGLFNLQLQPGAIIDQVSPDFDYTYDSTTGVFSTEVDTLVPFDCFYFYFNYENPCTVEAGDTICFSTFLDLSGIDPECALYSEGQTEVCVEVTGSYDPNDKRGLTRGETENNYVEPGTELEYMIRFQNTGTDTAFTVRIEDVLSDQFDISTLRPILASHDYKMTVDENRTLQFLFEDILLVDSFTNEPASHGFVKFAIQLDQDLAPSEEIFNQAAIFFDANDPIITNNFKYSIFPIDYVLNIELKALRIHPNPAQDRLVLTTDMKGEKSIIFTSIDGRKILLPQHFKGEEISIDVQTVQKGVYFIQIENEYGERSESKKVVKM